MQTTNKNLEPLGLLGMVVIGNTAINVAAIASVTEVTPTDYRIHLLDGHEISLEDDDATAFVETLRAIMRQAQFGGGVPKSNRIN